MQKYFVSDIEFDSLILTSDYNHITKVLRRKVNDTFLISNNIKTYLVEIKEITKNTVVVKKIKEEYKNNELDINLTLVQGLVKQDKLELIIKHSAELGLNNIIPTIFSRCNVFINNEKKDIKNQRFNVIAKEASEQALRDKKLNVLNTVKLKEIDFNLYDYIFVCYENSTNSLSNLENEIKKIKKGSSVCIIVGPEGGISIDEINFLKSFKSYVDVSLGRRILRTETASLNILSIISFVRDL